MTSVRALSISSPFGSPSGIAADLTAFWRGGRFIDVPLSERRGIENIFVPATNQDDRIIRARQYRDRGVRADAAR